MTSRHRFGCLRYICETSAPMASFPSNSRKSPAILKTRAAFSKVRSSGPCPCDRPSNISAGDWAGTGGGACSPHSNLKVAGCSPGRSTPVDVLPSPLTRIAGAPLSPNARTISARLRNFLPVVSKK